MEVEQAPFTPTIARCYQAILSIEHDLSQKLDLEAVAIVAMIPTLPNGVSMLNQTD